MDFFPDAEEKMPPVEFLTGLIRKIPSIDDVHYERLFDRRIFLVAFQDDEKLNVGFTTYPFKSIAERTTIGKLVIDSPLNIVTSKLFAITDRYDPKDFVDLYFAIQTYKWKLDELIKMTEERFDIKGLNHFIPERLLLVRKIDPADLPIMLMEINIEQMKEFFVSQTSDLVKSRKEI